jgi:catechol 2,3-dioxygenase-like lactoylglutathione lyase family enzyme
MLLRALDHVVVVVDSLDTAAATFEDLGFVVTHRSDQPFGTSNRLVVLDDVYLELVTVTRPDAVPPAGFARSVADELEKGRLGPSMIALRSMDPLADLARLEAAGISVDPILRFGREALLPGGVSHRVEFEVVFPEPVPGGPNVFLCHHLTPEIIWHPQVVDHRDGARRLRSLRLPDLSSVWWERLAVLSGASGSPPFRLGDIRVETGPPGIVIGAAESAVARVAGTTIDLVNETAP